MTTPPPRSKQLILKVKSLMKETRTTQKDIAVILGKSPRTVQNRLAGLTSFEVEEVWDLEEHFQVSLITPK